MASASRWAAAAVGAGAGFVALAVLVITRNELLLGIDTAVHEWLYDFGASRPAWRAAMSGVTQLGATPAVAALTVGGVAVCLLTGRKRDAAFVATASVATFVVSRVIRAASGRPRPVERIWEADGASFPSGHTANAAAAATIAVLVCWPLLSSLGRALLLTGSVAYTAAVAVSRLAGGVHWASDVVASCILSVACVTAIGAILARCRSGG